MAAVVGTAAASGTPAAPVRVGPGPVAARLVSSAPPARLSISPNRPGARNRVSLSIGGARPARHATVTLSFSMLTMAMGPMRFGLPETQPGVYTYAGPIPSMRGTWRLRFAVELAGGRRRSIVVDDAVG